MVELLAKLLFASGGVLFVLFGLFLVQRDFRRWRSRRRYMSEARARLEAEALLREANRARPQQATLAPRVQTSGLQRCPYCHEEVVPSAAGGEASRGCTDCHAWSHVG